MFVHKFSETDPVCCGQRRFPTDTAMLSSILLNYSLSVLKKFKGEDFLLREPLRVATFF